MGKMIKGWKCAECGRDWYTEEEASACFLRHHPANVMDNGRVGAILDRLQERLQQDPEEFDDLLDRIEEVI